MGADYKSWLAFFNIRDTPSERDFTSEDLSLMRLETRPGSSLAKRLKALEASLFSFKISVKPSRNYILRDGLILESNR